MVTPSPYRFKTRGRWQSRFTFTGKLNFRSVIPANHDPVLPHRSTRVWIYWVCLICWGKWEESCIFKKFPLERDEGGTCWGGRRDVCTASASRGGYTRAISQCCALYLSFFLSLNVPLFSFQPHPSLFLSCSASSLSSSASFFPLSYFFFYPSLFSFFLFLPSPCRLPLKPMTVNFSEKQLNDSLARGIYNSHPETTAEK